MGRFFIDYLRNGPAAKTISGYSVRTREVLPASMPIFCEELLEIEGANVWSIHNLRERLEQLDGAPWADLPRTRQAITAEIRQPVGIKQRIK